MSIAGLMGVLFLIAVGIVVLTMLGLSMAKEIEFLEKTIEEQARETARLAEFDGKMPVGAKFYFDKSAKRRCKRCNVGDIWWRFRYKVVLSTEEEPKLKELTRIYWCSGCSFRGASLTSSL